MNGYEGEYEEQPDDRSPPRSDRGREWLGGEAMVSFHPRRGFWNLSQLARMRCNTLALLFVFSSGVVVGGVAAGWRPFRSRRRRRP
jgi:hypothetical protein